jgi:hypothetical protein
VIWVPVPITNKRSDERSQVPGTRYLRYIECGAAVHLPCMRAFSLYRKESNRFPKAEGVARLILSLYLGGRRYFEMWSSNPPTVLSVSPLKVVNIT